MFTAEQLNHLDAFGFVILRQYLTPNQNEQVDREFDAAMVEDRQGDAFDGSLRHSIYGFVERRPSLTWLVEDDIIYQPTVQLLGSDFIFLISESNLFVGNTKWHPDFGEPEYRRIKFTGYLDPLTKDSGSLRVIPGSHKRPFHDELKILRTRRDDPNWPFGVDQPDIPSFALETDPGDVIVFDQATWHASFGGHAGRRSWAVTFAQKPTTDEHVKFLRDNWELVVGHTRRWQKVGAGRLSDDSFLYSERPRIRDMMSKWLEIGMK